MADKRAPQKNILKHTIEEQLKKTPSSAQEKSYAPAEEAKQGWFSKLFRPKSKQGMVVAANLEDLSKKQEGKVQSSEQTDVKFGEFEHSDLEHQHTKSAEIDGNSLKEDTLVENANSLGEFQGNIQETPQSGLAAASGIANASKAKIEETPQSDLAAAPGIANEFKGKIEQAPQSGLQARSGTASEFKGTIKEKSAGLETLPGEDLKETQTKKKAKLGDPEVVVDLKNNAKNSDKKAAGKTTASEQIEEKITPAKVLVSVGTNNDGDITDLHKFMTAQPSKKAIAKGYSPKGKLPQIVRTAKKKGRSVGDESGKISLSRSS